MDIILNTKYCPGDEVTVYQGTYADGSIALQLKDTFYDDEIYATPTINPDHYGEKPAEGNVFIKSYSESEGMMESLVDQGVISAPVREILVPPFGALVYECTLIGETVKL
jgi:hypothetical protein